MDENGVVILTPGPREHELPCSKCGETIKMSDDLYRQMVAVKGQPAHATCPNEAAALEAALREYRVTITVDRAPVDQEDAEEPPVVLSRVSATAEARTLVEAMPRLGALMAERWDKLIEAAPLAELDD